MFEKLKQFFINSSDDQLSVETILLDYIPTDFATRRYADITAFFYNVKFLDEIIEIFVAFKFSYRILLKLYDYYFHPRM